MKDPMNVQVILDGKIVNMSGYEQADYMQRLASFVNEKIREVREESVARGVDRELRPLIVSLNIADELMRERERCEQLTEDVKTLAEELAMIKQELAELRAEYEDVLNEKA